jgi:abortive infection bacteriophage resistance protein
MPNLPHFYRFRNKSEHYYQTYSTPDMPPSWMVFESLNSGTVSFAYMNLAHPGFVTVCGSYGLPHPILVSWLHSINYIRNICAHYSRLWNRECRIRPLIARTFKADLTPNERVYAQLVVMQIMLANIAPANHWAQKLHGLLGEHPTIPLAGMGFPAGWASRRVWNLHEP